MSGARFKGASSIEDMLGWQKNSFNNSFKIADSGISEYTMEQIRAKAAVLDLNESLTTQAVSLAKDADFSAKAATGKLTFKKALDDNSISFSDFGDKLENNKLLTESQSKSLKGLAENLGRDSDDYKNYASTLINTNDELANSIISVETTSVSSGKGLSSYFKGILATAKQLAPLLATIGVAFAAYKGFQFLDDKFTLTFSTAQKHMEESASAYESNYSELQSINSELETTSSRIAELKSQGTLTFAEETELAKLERQNSLLEAQQKLKQGATDSAQKQAASDAATSINFKSEKSIQTRTDKNGMDMQVAIDRKQYVKEQVSMMQEAQRQIDEATDKINSGDKSKKWKKQLESAQNNLNEYKQNAMNTLSDLNSEAENLYDKNTGQVINGYESLVNEINGLNNLVNNFDLSPLEKNKATIDSFFDGSAGTNFLKDELIDVAKSGEITTDTLADMGLTLEDLGLSGKDGLSALNKYFKDLASSADEANSSVKEFDGSLQSITDASESENQDKNWNTVSDLFDKAKELDKNKKWGTDDFQSMAQFIAPESAQVKTNNVNLKAADYKNLWDQYKGNFEKYFDTDNPLQSAINAQDQLIRSGLGSMGSDGIIKWSDSFKSSADAAKAWGISVEAAEVAMRNLESYGAEFDGITFNAEELDNYKASLDGIKSIYDSMEDGAEKDRLGSLIEGWDAEYAKYEQDISTLSEDQVVKIKFEYDLAELQQKIQEARDTAESSDSNSDWAKVVAGQKQERSKLESQTGYTKESDSGYAASYDKLDSLRKERNKASGDAKTEITKEMSAIGDLQNAFQQFRLEGGNLNWEDYLKSDQATATLQDIMDSTQLTEEQIASLFGMKPEDMTFDIDADDSKAKDKMAGVLSNDGKTITMNVDASTEEIQAQINQLQAGQTLLFQAEVDGEPKGIEAIKRQDGTIAYTVEDNGVQYYLEEVRNEDGTISYTLGDYPKEVPPTDQEVYRHPDNSEVSQDAPGVGQTVKRTPDNSGIMSNPPAVYQTVIRTATNVSSGVVSAGKNAASQIKANLKQRASGTLLSPAHAYGTARQLASQDLLAPAYADGKVSLPNDEYALVNELGTESRIRNGVWSLLPPGMHMENLKKGDIILNAKQTSDLLKSGKTTGTARAYASGSLLAPAYGSGMLSLGGSYGSSYGKSYGSTTTKSTKAKTSTNTASKAAQAATQVAEDLYDFVEILLDRTKELTEKLTDAIDDAVSLSDKMSKNSSALSQIQNEISVNQQAYQKYLAQANAVGLAEGYASQIRNGSLNIENITDENLKKKIDDYKKYYELALNAQKTIRDLQKDEKELALDRLEYIESYYDALVSLNDAYKDVDDARLDYLEKLGSSAITDDIKGYYQNSYDKEYDSYGKALQQLADYTQEVNELLANNYLQEGSEDYLEAMKTIQEFTKQVDESATALIELEDKIREIDYTRLQQIIDGSDRRTDQLKNAQSLAEARDEQIGRDEYQKQIDELSKSINANYALREAKIQEQNLYDVTSTRYQELAKEIADLDGQIYDDLVDIEDLKDQIFEAEFFNFDKEQENLEYFIGELDDFAKLLNSDAYFDKTGAFTNEVYAKISLTADAMSKCKQATANATEALKKLDEMYQNGLISETEYTDKQHDLLDVIRKNISATDDYKKELIDLYEEQMEKSNDALKENIRLRKEALSNAKDYEDFADSLKDKTKTVNELDSQINALQNVNNSQARSELKRLMAQRADAQKELDNLKKDHTYNLMQDGYDIMSENLDKSLEDISYSIATSSEKQLQVVQSMLSQMVGSYTDAFNKISSIISNTGFVGTGSFNNTVSNVGSSTGSSSIASGATQDQSTIKPSDSASNINSDNIQNGEHGVIETEIKKEPNTDNRLCAELKISATSVSVQEGSQTSITAKIRPNDAKNKTLSWSSADSSIASVSTEGKITGVKPGNTTITVSTTDGSGLMQTCKVTVTKKPDPPKPTPPAQPSSPQGNGVPDVGDKVTFVSGIYHEDSYGGGRWGNWELGGSVYITKINPGAPYPIHISKGNRLGSSDRGWLRLDQLRGYNRGARRITNRQWAYSDDSPSGSLDLGSEVVITKDGVLQQFDAGDTVFSNGQVQYLWEMSKGNISPIMNLNTGSMLGKLPEIVNRNDMSQNIYVGDNMESLFTIKGNVTKDALPGLEKAIEKMIPKISDELGIYLKTEKRL